jgi:hypothetical protein
MIEDIGPTGLAMIGLVVLFCFAIWFWNYKRYPLNEMLTGHLYMLYFFGDHSVEQIKNEMGDYSRRQIWNDMLRLEELGYVERADDNEGGYWLAYDGVIWSMTDAGEAAYKEHARHYDIPYDEDEQPSFVAAPAERRPS